VGATSSKGTTTSVQKDDSKAVNDETENTSVPIVGKDGAGTTPPALMPKVDASKLEVINPRIGKLLEGGTRKEIVDFAISGTATYAQWQLCPQEASSDASAKTCVETESQACGPGGACIQNVTPYNKILFPHLYAGAVLFSIRACVESANAVDPSKPCGPYKTIPYNSNYNNLEVNRLFRQRQDILDSLNKYGEEMQQLYVLYKGDLMQCLQFDAAHAAYYEGKINAISGLIEGVFFKMFIWAPETLLNELQKTSVGGALIGGAKSALNKVGDQIGKLKDSFCAIGETTSIDTTCMAALKDSNSTSTTTEKDAFCQGTPKKGGIGKFCETVGMIAKMGGGMLSAMNPAESIAVLSNSIHTISDPEHAVSMQCRAEQKLSTSSQAINQAISVLTMQLVECNNKLRALGEL